jgi:hypothetical protein
MMQDDTSYMDTQNYRERSVGTGTERACSSDLVEAEGGGIVPMNPYELAQRPNDGAAIDGSPLS